MNFISLPFKSSSVGKNITAAVALSGLLLCSTITHAEDTVLATVNGYDISESQLEIAAAQSKLDFSKITPEQKSLLIEALINRQLVFNEAVKANYDKDKDIAARVKALTDSYIAANYLASIAESFKMSESDLKAYYDKNIIANTSKEYKARHILVKTEDEAKALIKEIEGGADFSKLAQEKSIDTGSAARGGDLDWFTEQDMVAPFSQAIAKLTKGQLGKTPVQSQFGWHVIILDDERNSTPPAFETVKQSIEKELIKEKLNKYLGDLNAGAKIILK